ncbi:MAG TPA: M14 family metallopeptidase, partial [Actinomycetota bacterium]|nr:M14 family metallopeptidase [Actinomycetota bacterium]
MIRLDHVRFPAAATALLLLVVGLIAGVPAAAQTAGCHPILAEPTFLGEVPRTEDVTLDGAPLPALGSREITVAESDAYLEAVDDASDRVVTDVAGHSVEGRPLMYAIVGRAEHVTDEGLAAIRASIEELRDPATTSEEAAALAASTPAILYVQANVHGGEESGTESSLRLLHELADRDDCVSNTILDNAIVVILPVQNPDGRVADTRRNAYDIDMNRDWFARTQPETDAKLELLRRFPPVLDLDVHEMGASTYFFPPNSDPVYHEIADVSNAWINGLYGPALAEEFDRQRIRFFNYEPYDFFGTFYGDTVPTVAFHGAGMTFEKQSSDPLPVRMYEQYVTSIVSVFAAASHKDEILVDWHGSWVEAYGEGVAGTLEENEVFQKGHSVREDVPAGAVVRHYFLLDDPTKTYETQRLVRRLQRMDVEVFRLTADLAVPGFRAYGREPDDVTLPAGTYWIPLAQRQKHWIQSMLHEDSYIPHDVTYDVTGWSNPLAMNVPGGFTAAQLDPVAAPVEPLDEPAWPFDAPGAPNVAVFEGPGSTALESRGAVRWLFDRVWGLGFDLLSGGDVAAGALDGYDVLVMPDGYPNYALQALGAKGKKALVAWANAGGHVIAWEGSAEVVTRIGVSTAALQVAHTNMPGSLVRVALDGGSPLADGVGPFAWAMFEDDPVMTARLGDAPVTFPAAASEDFFVSGLDAGAEQLAGTAAVVDEAVGDGRATVLTFDPVFRGWTDGTQRILWNAIAGTDPFPGAAAAAGSAERLAAERAAREDALGLPQVAAPFRLTVAG